MRHGGCKKSVLLPLCTAVHNVVLLLCTAVHKVVLLLCTGSQSFISVEQTSFQIKSESFLSYGSYGSLELFRNLIFERPTTKNIALHLLFTFKLEFTAVTSSYRKFGFRIKIFEKHFVVVPL